MRKNILINDELISVEISSMNEQEVTFSHKGKEYKFALTAKDRNSLTLSSKDSSERIFFDGQSALVNGLDFKISNPLKTRNSGKSENTGGSISPMPGKILKVLVEQGSEVKKGETLLVMEAMKMEHAIKAKEDSVVKELYFNTGDLVDGGVELLLLAPIEG